MSSTTFFVQPCPTCGRRTQVLVKLLGTTVRCQHCTAEFEARDPSAQELAEASLMDRVEQLLGALSEPPTLEARAS